jgi:hypothetical protein
VQNFEEEVHVASSQTFNREWCFRTSLTEESMTRCRHRLRPGAHDGWEAALLEFEHQAEHWDTPDHGEIGNLIAQALRSAVDIAESGGLRCEHRIAWVPAVAPEVVIVRNKVSGTHTPARWRRRAPASEILPKVPSKRASPAGTASVSVPADLARLER